MKTKSPDIEFILNEKISKLIKVIGVGGAGSNAVNYMYENEPLEHVDYIVCNTDLQALNYSPVPVRIQIGKKLTGGLGAGNKPETGKKAAQEDLDDVRKVLEDNTKMLFITAGMGGGTGTGAAPEIAKLAKEMGILTVAVVTVPFHYEGPRRMEAARKGIDELRRYVDSLLVVNNQRLIEIYGDLDYRSAFHKSDEVLANAVRSVSKVIMSNYHINVDFNDVETILRNSGTAILGTAAAEGENRAKKVIENALHSPLLNDNRIEGAKNVLLLIISGTETATVNEISYINEYIRKKAGDQVDIIMGLGQDPSLERQLAVTVIATGFHPEKQKEIESQSPPLIINVPDIADTDEKEEDEEITAYVPPAAPEKTDENEPPTAKTEADEPQTDTSPGTADHEKTEETPPVKQKTLFDFFPEAGNEEETTAEQPEQPQETAGEDNSAVTEETRPPQAEKQTPETEIPSGPVSDEDAPRETDFFVQRFKKIEQKKNIKSAPSVQKPAGVQEPPARNSAPGLWNDDILRKLEKYVFKFPPKDE